MVPPVLIALSCPSVLAGGRTRLRQPAAGDRAAPGRPASPVSRRCCSSAAETTGGGSQRPGAGTFAEAPTFPVLQSRMIRPAYSPLLFTLGWPAPRGLHTVWAILFCLFVVAACVRRRPWRTSKPALTCSVVHRSAGWGRSGRTVRTAPETPRLGCRPSRTAGASCRRGRPPPRERDSTPPPPPPPPPVPRRRRTRRRRRGGRERPQRRRGRERPISRILDEGNHPSPRVATWAQRAFVYTCQWVCAPCQLEGPDLEIFGHASALTPPPRSLPSVTALPRHLG